MSPVPFRRVLPSLWSEVKGTAPTAGLEIRRTTIAGAPACLGAKPGAHVRGVVAHAPAETDEGRAATTPAPPAQRGDSYPDTVRELHLGQ